MKKLLLLSITLLVLIFSPGDSASFDGLKEAKNLGSNGSVIQAETAFLKNLSKLTLSQDNEPSIMGGYLSLIKLREYDDPEKYDRLIKNPKSDAYVQLFENLNNSTHLFNANIPSTKGNFALNTITTLQKTVTYYNNAIPYNTRDQHALTDKGLEDVLHLNALETEVDDASHKIVTGAFGFGKTATKDQAEMMASNLIESVKRLYRHKGDIQEILKTYALDRLTKQDASRDDVKKHIQSCRAIIRLTYYALNERDLDEIAFQTLWKQTGREFQAWTDIRDVFRVQGVRDAFEKQHFNVTLDDPKNVACKISSAPLTLPKTGEEDYKLSPVSQKLFETYSSDARKFDTDITKDILKYADNSKILVGKPGDYTKYTQRALVVNAVNFLIATQTSNALNVLSISAYKDGNVYNESPNNRLYLTSGNKNLDTYKSYRFHLDKTPLENAFKAVKPIISLVYLDQIFSERVLKDSKYNLDTIREHIGKFWHTLYENLVYGYVFAKEHGKEKSFFANAFPRELHCTDSLSSMTNAWVASEKKTVGLNIEQASAEKLRLQTKELIDADNVFIGAMVNNFIQYWLTPHYLTWAEKNGYKVSPQDIENNAGALLPGYEDGKKLSHQFAQDIEKLLLEAAKERAVIDFNKGTGVGVFSWPPVQQIPFSPLDKTYWHFYSTTDSDLIIPFELNQPNLHTWQNKIAGTNIKTVKIFVKINNEYKELRDYLREKYKAYFW